MARTLIGLWALTLVLILSGVAYVASFPKCPTEDSTNCYWDAANRGNGQGNSFINFKGITILWGSK